jgi:3-phytase
MRRTAGIVVLVALTTAVAAPAQAGGKPADESKREITAIVETPALFDDAAGGDADADDPAIWVNRADRSRSRVIGTAKNGGLRVYDLAGREVQSILPPEGGRFNNVDLITGFGPQKHDLAVVTDRGRDELRIYRIEQRSGHLTDVTADNAPLLFSRDQAEVETQATGYGLATYGRYAVDSRRHSTRLGIFRLEEQRGGRIGYRVTDTLDLPKQFALPNGETWTPCLEPGEEPQVEGMVVDAEAGVLYAAQEDVALWRIPLDRDRFGGLPRVVEKVAEFGAPGVYDPETEECTVGPSPYGGRIKADVEGTTIYSTGKKSGYLVVSSQGDSQFYVYDRRTNRPVTSFQIVAGRTADGVQHSDGAAATAEPLPGYPRGLLVLHDGENTPDGGRVSTDFKYVDWRALGLRQ